MLGFGKIFIILGLCLVVLGLVMILTIKYNFPLGRLPGDILIKRDNFVFYFPLATSIIISLIVYLVTIFIKR